MENSERANEIGTGPLTVLVTGGTGFVGTYVCKHLAARGDVPLAGGLEDFSSEGHFVLCEHGDKVRFVHCDVTDAEEVEVLCRSNAVDAIVHSAGFVGHDASLSDPARTYQVNIGGAVNVLEAARKAGVPKVILVSSNAAYHEKEYAPFDERHRTTSLRAGNPNAHYGTAKMAAEQIGLAYHTFHGIDVTALRVTAVYGFGMNVPMFVKPMVEGVARGETVAIPSGGRTPRDYTYIDDVVSGILAVLDADTRDLEQRIFNMSSGVLVTAGEIAALMRRLAPGAAVSIADEATPAERANIAQRAPLSSAAALKVFGYAPDYSIDAGIAAYLDDMTRFLVREVAPSA